MSTSSTEDRVMQTMARYFDVAAEGAGGNCPVQDAIRRAAADPGFRDELCQVIRAEWHRQGSFSACTNVSPGGQWADVIAWLPDSAGQACVLEAKARYSGAGTDPGTGASYLVLLLAAAVAVDRSSLGAADAWSLRRLASAGDVAAVREALRRLTADEAPAGRQQEPTAGRQEPGCPGTAADPQYATTPAEFTDALARFRTRAGKPSYREMASRARPATAASTLLEASRIRGGRLPSLRVVAAYVTGCGGDQEDLARFTEAWRRISLSSTPRRLNGVHPASAACPCKSPSGQDATPGT